MSTPMEPPAGTHGTGGQQPTNEPRGGMTSAEGAGSIRDRLRNPGPQSEGGDTRRSNVREQDFQQTDTRQRLSASGRTEQQYGDDSPPAVVQIEQPHGNALDPAEAARAERRVAGLFLLAVLGVVGFFGIFWFAPWKFGVEAGNTYFTPALGLFMGLALFGIGAGAVVWAKELMVDEEAVQERHPFASPQSERLATVEAFQQGVVDSGVPRRNLLKGSLLLGAGSLAILPVPFLFTLGPYAHKERALRHTSWGPGIRLIRQDGSPVRLGDLLIGGVESVFPDVPRGTKLADSPALLIRMRPEVLRPELASDTVVQGHIVYSSICTHLGCPVKLYEQETHHLLCPCHQSTFDAANGAHVIFGPAARPLPQLPITVDAEGYFVATGDFPVPIGPSFWERDAK